MTAPDERTDNPDEAAGLRLVAGFLRTPPKYPVLGHPRRDQDEEVGRVVLKDTAGGRRT